MTALENVTAGITLGANVFADVLSVFTSEPLCWFVGIAIFGMIFAMGRKILMPRKKT